MQALNLADSDDESLRALDFILQGWDAGSEAGIAPEFMAYAALYAGLTDLVGTYGEDAVVKLVTGLVTRVKEGEFTLVRTRQ
ncbi:MAG TPA: hypothetical protein PK264_03585 [Hyphomicrobiaceae bacterium]|nr:hypothetical protein [Hyphomicrobiaceae bacterium]